MTALSRLGDDFNFSFDPGMVTDAVTAPAVVTAPAPLDLSTLFNQVKAQAPSLLTNYVQKRINAATQPKAPKVVQAPAVQTQSGSRIGSYAVPAGIAALTVGGIALMARKRNAAR